LPKANQTRSSPIQQDLEKTGIDKAFLYSEINDHNFPKQIKVSPLLVAKSKKKHWAKTAERPNGLPLLPQLANRKSSRLLAELEREFMATCSNPSEALIS
jgi:predicted DNA-binding transcriptional regulator AlpA